MNFGCISAKWSSDKHKSGHGFSPKIILCSLQTFLHIGRKEEKESSNVRG